MANTNSPFGFRQFSNSGGAAPTYGQSKYRIAAGNATPIYFGDPVQPVVSTATGYIIQGTASTTIIAGIFVGCEYLSTSQKRTVRSLYWPGADATGDVTAWVIDDPNALFVVQGGSTTFNISGTLSSWTSSPVGQYAQYTVGSGNTTTGQSGAYLSAVGTTVTYPFIVRDLITAPPGANGADPTTAYNWVVVGFNDQLLRTNGAGPTGIA
jgi:hypothetical protein